MNKREVYVLIALIVVLCTTNIVNYLRRKNLKQNYVVLVEEASVQISINNADAKELEYLPGIGPALAHRIVEYRETKGGFRKLEDLKNVKGIGKKLYKKIVAYIKL